MFVATPPVPHVLATVPSPECLARLPLLPSPPQPWFRPGNTVRTIDGDVESVMTTPGVRRVVAGGGYQVVRNGNRELKG